ncbi:MAG: DNA alkylation repair protein [Deltaproteobacteria bacterium]|nr:DNA alkylation repair protein [Deltaproteobacteria bacterium]
MAEPLKNQFGVEIPGNIARMISRVFPAFAQDAFVKDALDGYEALDLMPRGWKIARTLRGYLPFNYPEAVEILIESLGPKLDKTEGHGMAPFLYLPHDCFVAEFGLDHFEVSMRALYEITQRFSAEFSIRPFLVHHTEATLAYLKGWAKDPSPHVRRLVSEGTRPRLPWAPRLREFQKDPRPVLALLELLKDDPELYVRRSVANNLNDIGKDHPALLVETARRWMNDATDERRRLVNHALRSAVKRAEPRALEIMGFGEKANVSVGDVRITPQRAIVGGTVKIAFQVTNTDSCRQRVLVDFRIHFMKSSGKTSPKVFKLRTIDLAPRETVKLEKFVSLAKMTTRKHYAGTHKVDILINGHTKPLGTFELSHG